LHTTIVPRLFVSVVLKHVGVVLSGPLFMRVLSFWLCSVSWRPVQMSQHRPLYLTVVGL